MEERKMICIRCPRGCEITTSLDGQGAITSLEGNVCRLGEQYVRDEISDPRRIVTSTVKVKGGKHPLVPVWTAAAIPKDKIFDLMGELRRVELTAPVRVGQTVLQDPAGIGCDVTVSGWVDRETEEK